ncbi:hypothetical protein [Lactobacillus selangorensis]|uniref:Uncharacterized protein n=1 Tax=Lactobacillus selangorensis TaxID=81857 RepID=A0A0R2FNH3_9LACO|nr:hypothetical protein [Lactobacillus selangorensis]KRN30131.1 hypothetical protein IV40_GL001977 [Lactobacillus selangorensis]
MKKFYNQYGLRLHPEDVQDEAVVFEQNPTTTAPAESEQKSRLHWPDLSQLRYLVVSIYVC